MRSQKVTLLDLPASAAAKIGSVVWARGVVREAMKQQGERKDLSDNVTEVSGPTGN